MTYLARLYRHLWKMGYAVTCRIEIAPCTPVNVLVYMVCLYIVEDSFTRQSQGTVSPPSSDMDHTRLCKWKHYGAQSEDILQTPSPHPICQVEWSFNVLNSTFTASEHQTLTTSTLALSKALCVTEAADFSSSLMMRGCNEICEYVPAAFLLDS